MRRTSTRPPLFDEIARAVGCRIVEQRRALGLTQEELAHRVGLSVQRLSSIERGKVNFTLRTFVTLSRALEVRMVDLLQQPTLSPDIVRGRPRLHPPKAQA